MYSEDTEIMSYEALKQNILDNVSHRGAGNMKREGKNILKLPPEIGLLRNAREIGFQNNHLTDIPVEVSNLYNLEKLDLRNNRLSSLPLEFANLTNLEMLLLGQNQFTKFPQAILNLKRLVYLDLSHNFIEDIPEELFNLENLVVLKLQRNRIRQIPSHVIQLKKLHTLDISNNLITRLPLRYKDVLSLGDRFNHVIFYGNPLFIPPEMFGLTTLNDFWDVGWVRYFHILEELYEQIAKPTKQTKSSQVGINFDDLILNYLQEMVA